MKNQLFYGVEFPRPARRVELTKTQLVLVILNALVLGVAITLLAIGGGIF